MILITDATRDYVLSNRGSRALPLDQSHSGRRATGRLGETSVADAELEPGSRDADAAQDDGEPTCPPAEA